MEPSRWLPISGCVTLSGVMSPHSVSPFKTTGTAVMRLAPTTYRSLLCVPGPGAPLFRCGWCRDSGADLELRCQGEVPVPPGPEDSAATCLWAGCSLITSGWRPLSLPLALQCACLAAQGHCRRGQCVTSSAVGAGVQGPLQLLG